MVGFFAYPDGHPIITDAVDGAVSRSNDFPLRLKS